MIDQGKSIQWIMIYWNKSYLYYIHWMHVKLKKNSTNM